MQTCQELTPEVIEAINEEIRYVNGLQGTDRADGCDYGVAGQLVALEYYVAEARRNWVCNSGEQQSLDALRKCAQIACRALIKCGCPRRGK